MKRTTSLKRKSRYKSDELKRFHSWVAEHGCLVCRAPAEVHHVTAYADRPGRIARSDFCVVPLCPTHHRVGAVGGFYSSVEALGHQGFAEVYGVDLHAEAMRLAEQWQKMAA